MVKKFLCLAVLFTASITDAQETPARARTSHLGFEISGQTNPTAAGAGIFLIMGQRHQLTLQWLLPLSRFGGWQSDLPSGSLQYDFYWTTPGKRFLSPSLFAAVHYCQMSRHDYWVMPGGLGGSALAASSRWTTQDAVAGIALGFRLGSNLLLRTHAGLRVLHTFTHSNQNWASPYAQTSSGKLVPFLADHTGQALHFKASLTWIIRDVFPVVRW